MLSVNHYPKAYIDACRLKVNQQVAAYREMISAMRHAAQSNGVVLDRSIEKFEHQFFNHMVLVLDNYFSNRSRTLEKKDGNPCNEVRVLCNSLMTGDGMLTVDKTIKFDPAKSILGLQPGQPIRLVADQFAQLAHAYFAEIENKYG